MVAEKYVRELEQGYPKVLVAETGNSHANDPYVLKKLARAKEMFSKVKLPDHLKK
ncbi:hypothetical protein SAMN04487898_113181 [Pedobacter sp. ok626]|uniref:hypothetical protein n=1 Tax=Pedobacter sp. ok626 TaxID=1761882 RepID=UPI000887D360|nr:hypothetical protein [Pedobacter sp. ok626]SDK97638.1 hypothetical protein SAMN04487898_113181 [Pedobacter sp. ok626]